MRHTPGYDRAFLGSRGKLKFSFGPSRLAISDYIMSCGLVVQIIKPTENDWR